MPNRRTVISRSAHVAAMLATLGLWPRALLAQAGWNPAAFDAKSIDALMKVLGGAKPQPSADVTLDAPDIAENGALVPVALGARGPGVRRLLLLVEKNPNLLAAGFEPGEGFVPKIATRIKMAQSSKVWAIAMYADGRVLYASRDVAVTLGGCG
jgi:sulfur-oxidizing protein SoxY